MPERTINGGAFRETWTNSATPTKDNSQTPHPRLTSGQARVYVKFDISGIRRQTVATATLRVRVKAIAAQTWTVTPVAERMAMRQVNDGNQPTLRTAEAFTVAVPATVDADYVEIPLVAYLQTIADGTENYGLKISTNSTADNRIYGTESEYKNDTWQLVYSVQEVPDPPTDLSPAGGVVSSAKPVVCSAFRDPGGESKSLAALRVEVGHMSGTTFVADWASGDVTTEDPRLDLSATTYPGATSGVETFWRMAHMDGAGYWSDWSDPASFTYTAKPTISVTNVTGGVVYDVTPTFDFTVSAGTIQKWRLEVYNADKTRMLYDSRLRDGASATSVAHEVPFRDPASRQRIIRDDHNYWLRLRTWDDLDRVATTGDPMWSELWMQFHADDDAAITVPTSLYVAQVGNSPKVRLSWEIPAGYAEGFVVRMAGEVVARLTLDDVTTAGDSFAYEFNGCPPYRTQDFTVAAVAGDRQSAPSAAAAISTEVTGFWLMSDRAEVCLDGAEVSNLTTVDKRARHALLNAPYDVDIVYALAGVSGTFTGTIGSTRGRDWEADYAALMTLRAYPEDTVQVAYGTASFPAQVSISRPLPDNALLPSNMYHRVSVDVQQVDDFEVA